MSNRTNRQDWLWAFVDLLLLMVSMFSSMYIITLLQVNPPAKKNSIELKAELVITMTWPGKAIDDLDLHLMQPDGRMINFATRESTYGTLDRDDLGIINDSYTDSSGQHFIEYNQEVITIRALVPGKYVVNAHVYRQYSRGYLSEPTREIISLPYKTKIVLQKLNPVNREIAVAELMLSEVGEQKTAFSFVVDEQGNVVNVNTGEDILFIPARPKAQ